MNESNYEDSRFGEIMMDEHLKPLIAHITKYIKEDAVFKDEFNAKFTAKKIIIKPAYDPDSVKNYYDSSFTSDGELLIEYRSMWTNISKLGEDLPKILGEGGDNGTYLCQKSIRKTLPRQDSHLKNIEKILGVTGITYDYCIGQNLAKMNESNYADERFGEIMLDVHLKQLHEALQKLCKADSSFDEDFVARFAAKKIIIRPAADPDSVKNYYDSSFTADGEFLVEYRSIWTNINKLGEDIPKTLMVNDVAYEVIFSIRQYSKTLEKHLDRIESILGMSEDIGFESCLRENLAAMEGTSYEQSRFGEIFFDEYMKPLVENIQRFANEDPSFAGKFKEFFSGKTIIIKPAADPNSVENYYESTFTDEGNLLIEYRSIWTNISLIGHDLATILNEDDGDEAEASHAGKKKRKPRNLAQKVVRAVDHAADDAGRKAHKEVKNIGKKLKKLF